MDTQVKTTKIFILIILLCFAKSGIAKKKVVIIGAGVSGLSAARVISQSGLADVRLVEASDRYGGRISTDKHKGHMFELGAQWIHGGEGNPVYEFLAENTNLKVESWSRYNLPKDTKFHYYSGREVTSDIKHLFWNSSKLPEYMDYAIQRLIEVENKTEEEMANISIREVAKRVWKKKFSSNNFDRSLAKNVADPILTDKLVFIHLIDAAKPGIVNSLAWYQYMEYGDNDVQLVHGYRSLTTKLRRSIPRNALKLNRRVESIEWFKENGKRIVVRYEKGGRKRKISADYVLVTVSLGVLKKYHKTLFVPNLPIEKQAAIEKMGFGTVNKMILFYENPFWGSEFADVHMLWDSYDETQNETLDEFAREDHWCRNLNIISSYGNNFLLLWLTEDASKSIRNISTTDIKSTVTNLLRKFLDKPELSGPDDIIMTEWDIDDNFLGSYSYLAIGQTKYYQRTLAEPLYVNGNPRVMFAGEAMSISRFSTVDGAFSTGKHEGERIVKLLENAQ